MERKEFLKQCGKLCLGSFIATELLSACTTNYFAQGSVSNNLLTVSKKEFIEVRNGKSKFRKHVIVKADKLTYPIYVSRLNENTYSALFMECSHNSCELAPHGDYLVCPCHGSEFNFLGKVQNPPAEKDLISFKINQDDENIFIQL